MHAVERGGEREGGPTRTMANRLVGIANPMHMMSIVVLDRVENMGFQPIQYSVFGIHFLFTRITLFFGYVLCFGHELDSGDFVCSLNRVTTAKNGRTKEIKC